jgi:Kef-type K+ transport system membrane component KefB
MIQIIWQLLLLVGVAHAVGWVFKRMRQPALVGYMVAGVLLGPSMLDRVTPTAALTAAADLALFFVVLAAGLELRIKDVSGLLRGGGLLTLLLGLFIPAAAAAALVWLLNIEAIAAAVIVLCVSVTALPVALQILRSFGLLETPMARVAIVSAVLSDVIVLMALGILIELAAPHGRAPLFVAGIALMKLAALVALVFAAHFLCEYLAATHATKLNGVPRRVHTVWTGVLAALLVSGLGFASAKLGLHFAIGAFFGAMMITRDLMGNPHFERFERLVGAATAAVFGPLFLAYQGVKFDLLSLGDFTFLGALLAVAVVSKLIAGYVVGRLQRMSVHEAIGVGIIMNARGVMEMVVASIAYRASLVSLSMYSSLLLIGLVTSMLTPVFLAWWKKGSD